MDRLVLDHVFIPRSIAVVLRNGVADDQTAALARIGRERLARAEGLAVFEDVRDASGAAAMRCSSRAMC